MTYTRGNDILRKGKPHWTKKSYLRETWSSNDSKRAAFFDTNLSNWADELTDALKRLELALTGRFGCSSPALLFIHSAV